jgi:hypothetical protein
VLIFVVLGVVIVLMLVIGGRAERFNLRGLTPPWQPRYDEDDEPQGSRDV